MRRYFLTACRVANAIAASALALTLVVGVGAVAVAIAVAAAATHADASSLAAAPPILCRGVQHNATRVRLERVHGQLNPRQQL